MMQGVSSMSYHSVPTWLADCLDPTAPSSEIKTLKSVRYALQKDTA